MFLRSLAMQFLMVVTLGLCSQQVQAADGATGTIEGRVLNLSNGQYLNSALVTVEGTSITTVTNEYGEYVLRNVPVGSVNLTVSYTGQESKTSSITVEDGKIATQDFGLSKSRGVADDGTIILDAYQVSQSRYKNAQELAINEERRSVAVKDVVASDALGYIPSGNVGEFVKYLPGVQTLYGGVDQFNGGIGSINPATASQVSMRGFSSAETSITIDGVPVAGVGPGQLTRAVGMDMMSINNASRIEAIKVPTPDMSGDSAGGAINLVTKSAWEYSKPSYSGSVGITYTTGDGNMLKRQPGPANKRTNHTLPSANLSVAIPYSKTLGFSVSLATANSYSPNYYVNSKWQSTNTWYTSGTTVTSTALRTPLDSPYLATWVTTASTTAGTTTTRWFNVGNLANGRLVDLTNPFLRQAIDQQNPWTENRYSAGLKVDWKPVSALQISVGYTGSSYQGVNVDRRFTVSQLYPMEWGADYQIGRPFEAARTGAAALNFQNKLEEEVTSRDKSGFTHTGFLRFTYTKGPWTISGSAGASRTDMDLDDFKNGHFYRAFLDGSNVVGQIKLSNIVDATPGKVEVWDRTGNPLNWHKINTWQFSDIKVGTAVSQQRDQTGDYKFDVRRDLDFLPFKMSLKVGGSRRLKDQRKSGLGTGYSMKYIGPVDSTFVDSVTDSTYTRTKGEGFAKNQDWIDVYKMYAVYQAAPDLFTLNPRNGTTTFADMSYPVNNYRSIINQTKSLKETSDSAYAMLDGSLFNNRLDYVIGVKQSRTAVDGVRPYNDSKWNYLKNPNGTLYTDSIYVTGVRIDWTTSQTTAAPSAPAATPNGFLADTALLQRLQAAGVIYPDHLLLGQGTSAVTSGLSTGDANRGNMEAAQRSLYLLSVNKKRTNPVQPSVILSYKIVEGLYFKPSWTRDISLPPLDAGNSQNASGVAGLLGASTVNPADPSAATYNDVGGAGTITYSNSALQPRTVDSFNGTLSYYNKYGNVTFTYYYKNIKNEWITDTYTSINGEFPQLLADLGFDIGTFYNWTVVTADNSNLTTHASGYEMSFRQNFGYLGDFMSHFNAFGNYSRKKVTQPNKSNVVAMTTFPNYTWAGGLNFSAYRCSLSAKMTFQNENWSKNGTVNYKFADGTTSAVQMYSVDPKMYLLDLDFTYQISQHVSYYLSGKNVLNTHRQVKQADALGLLPSYASITGNYEFGVQVATGIQLSF